MTGPYTIYGCRGCHRTDNSPHDLCRQGCEGKPEPFVPAHYLDRARQERSDAIRNAEIADEQMRKFAHLADELARALGRLIVGVDMVRDGMAVVHTQVRPEEGHIARHLAGIMGNDELKLQMLTEIASAALSHYRKETDSET